MKIYIKPPKKGVFAPQTKPCTKYMKPFSCSYVGKTYTTNYFLIDYGKIDCTPWESRRTIWDARSRVDIPNPKHVKSHWDYKPHWFYVDYFNRPHPNSTKKGTKK
jgi:hypothetical protein